MTVSGGPAAPPSVPTARVYAVITWVYAAGFGVPAVPVSIFVLQRGSLRWFGDLFPMYGGPWSDRLSDSAFVARLLCFVGLLAVVAYAAVQVRHGSRRGALVSIGLLPVEAVFWVGFALPIPLIVGASRVALLAAAWRRLREVHLKKEISHA